MSRFNFTLSVFFVVACAFVLCGCQVSESQLAARESRMAELEGGYGGYGGRGYAGESPKLYSQTAVSEREVEPEKMPEAESPEVDPARSERLVVYNAVINVVVQNISQSIGQIRSSVSAMGGYMQQMTSNSITFKVPAKRFTEALAEVEKLGEVTHKDIKGTDVTEQMRDLNIRLANAENVRGRLTKLLERADKVEDAIKIEKELERITETIELLKGKETAVVLRGSKETGLKQYEYLVALATSKKYITVFEAWGPLEQFEGDRSKIEEAVKSMRVR